jgi:signal transduction histidine kinase
MLKSILTNVVRHSKARQFDLAVRHEKNHLIIEISDDGRGFDPDRIPPDSQGVANIRDHARRLGGHLVLDTAPGRGTTYRIAISQLR